MPTKSATKRACRPAVDFKRRSNLLDAAVVHDHDPVGHRQGFLLVVGHHDRRHAEPPLQVPDFVAQPARAPARRAPTRVHRAAEARATWRAPAPRRPAAAARPKAEPDIFRPDPPDRPAAAARSRGRRFRPWPRPALFSPYPTLSFDRQVGEQRIGLEDDAEIALRWRQERDVAPTLFDPAAALESSPAIARSSVVLPQPEGPRKQTNSPSWMSSEMSLSA